MLDAGSERRTLNKMTVSITLKHKLAAVICAAVMAIATTGCGSEISGSLKKNDTSTASSQAQDESKAPDSSKPEEKPAESSQAPEESSGTEENKAEPSYKVSLLCVGDNLIHDNIYKEAEKMSGKKGEYNFDHAYKPIEDYIKGNDLAIINQETVVTSLVEPRTFPTFATPKANADKIKSLGFNAVSMCNNHIS